MSATAGQISSVTGLVFMAIAGPVILVMLVSAISSIIQTERFVNYGDQSGKSDQPNYYTPTTSGYVVIALGAASIVMFIIAASVAVQGETAINAVNPVLRNVFLILFVPAEAAIFWAFTCLRMWFVDNKRKSLGMLPKTYEL